MSKRSIIENYFKNLAPDTWVTQTEIATELLKQEGNPVNIDNVAKEQPNVSKALKQLIKTKKVIEGKGLNPNEKVYTAYSDVQERNAALLAFSESVRCLSPHAFKVSPTTIMFQPVVPDIYNATALVKTYLGDDRCFDVLLVNGYLVILIDSFSEDTKEIQVLSKIYTDINNAVIAAHQNHLASQPKKRLVKKAAKEQ